MQGKSGCRQPCCKTCAHMKLGIMFHSTTTGEKFWVKATTDCRTSNVIYLIKCKMLRPVRRRNGECTPRMTNSHRSDINNHRIEKPVTRHFTPSNHSIDDLSIMVIEGIHREDVEYHRWKKATGSQQSARWGQTNLFKPHEATPIWCTETTLVGCQPRVFFLQKFTKERIFKKKFTREIFLW